MRKAFRAASVIASQLASLRHSHCSLRTGGSTMRSLHHARASEVETVNYALADTLIAPSVDSIPAAGRAKMDSHRRRAAHSSSSMLKAREGRLWPFIPLTSNFFAPVLGAGNREFESRRPRPNAGNSFICNDIRFGHGPMGPPMEAGAFGTAERAE